jgi:hypothetical protein
MFSTKYSVDFRYTHEELLALFAAAEHGDVDKGRGYGQRGGSSHSRRAIMIRTFYVKWGDANCIYQIECDAGFDLGDLLHELAVLEDTALGYRRHGVQWF